MSRIIRKVITTLPTVLSPTVTTDFLENNARYHDLKLILEKDQPGIITVEHSDDAINTLRTETFTVDMLTWYSTTRLYNKYVKISFTLTGSSDCTWFEFNIISNAEDLDESLRYTEPSNVVVDSVVSVNPTTTQSGFFDLTTVNLLPVVTGDGTYVEPSNFRSFTSTSGSASTSNGLLKVESGTGAFGYAAYQSFRSISYREGLGAKVRIGAIFSEPTSNIVESGAGILSISDEASFGYGINSNTGNIEFGTWYRHDGRSEIKRLTVTGAAGGAEDATITINGTAYTVGLTATGTTWGNAYQIASNLSANIVASSQFTSFATDSNVTIAFLTDGAKAGTYTFSSSSATANFSNVTTGVTKTSEFTAKSDWSNGAFETFDPTKMNNYQITYQSVSAISYEIEDVRNNEMKTVHRMINDRSQPIFGNPDMRLGMYVYNNSSNISADTSNVSCNYLKGFETGIKARTRNPRTFTNTKTISTTETSIFALRNSRTFGSNPEIYNQISILPEQLSIANDSTSKSAVFNIRASTANLTSSVTRFIKQGSRLVSEVDTNAGAITSNGTLLASYVVGPGQSAIIDLLSLDIDVPPTLTLYITGRMTSGSADLTSSLVYYEDI